MARVAIEKFWARGRRELSILLTEELVDFRHTGVLIIISSTNTIFYSESILVFFARFVLDKNVHTFRIHTL